MNNETHFLANPPRGQVLGKGRYLVQASYPLKDIKNLIKIDFPAQEIYDTVGGFVTTEIWHVPVVGEKFDYKGATFTVMESDEKHVISVEIKLNFNDKEEWL